MNITARSNGTFVNNKPFKVLVCLVTLVAFLFNTVYFDVSWAVGTPSVLPGGGPDRAGGPGFIKELNVNTFILPEYLGRVKDSWSPTPQRNTKYERRTTIIHIQDAHCNYAAQKRIAEIVEYLNGQYGIDTINLEGGAKDYDLSVFTGIHEKAIREKAADYFVREGLVNGSEYFAINNPEKVTLWGIEDTKLYIDNLSVYRNSLQYKNEVDKHLKALTHILNNLKIKIYSRELLDLDAAYSQYKAGALELKAYLARLIQTAKDRAIDIKVFNNVYLLSRTLEDETEIDFKKANTQRDILIDTLQKKSSRKSLEELVLKSIEFKAGKISQKDFYAYLTNRAKLLNVDLKEFPDLQKYIVYISTYDAIDKVRAMGEMDGLGGKLKEALCQNDKQRELNRLSKNLAILKNIFNITLTRDDYKYYANSEQSFDIQNYVSFISKEAPLYKITARLDDNIADLDHYREDISKFYECSFKRDDVFLKNMKGLSLEGTVPNAAIIVTGGFHTENLCEIFKKNNISYISIMPDFKDYAGYECPYFKILSGEKNTNIRETLPSALKNALAIPDPLNPLITKAMEENNIANASKSPSLMVSGKLTNEQIESIVEPRYADDPALQNRIVALVDIVNKQSIADPNEILKLYEKRFHGQGGFLAWGRNKSSPSQQPKSLKNRMKTVVLYLLILTLGPILGNYTGMLVTRLIMHHSITVPVKTTTPVNIELLKERVNNPTIEKEVRIEALDSIVKTSRDTESLELARWLVWGYITQHQSEISNQAKLNVDLSKGDSYSKFLMKLVNNETLPLDLRIYALGLQPTKAIDIKRMAVLGKELINKEKNTPPESLLVSDSVWVNEKLKTYLLATFSVICGELKERGVPLDNERVITPLADKIINKSALLENIDSAEGVILANAALQFNRTAITKPAFNWPGAGVFFRVFAHEIGHKILDYSINYKSFRNWYGQESTTTEFYAELCSYSFFEAMDWKGSIRVLNEIAGQQHALIFKKEEKYGVAPESQYGLPLAFATIEEMNRYFDKERVQYPDRKIPSLCDVFAFSLKYCAGHKLSPDQKVFEGLIKAIMVEYAVPSNSISEETSILREKEKDIVIVPRWGLLENIPNKSDNLVASPVKTPKMDIVATSPVFLITETHQEKLLKIALSENYNEAKKAIKAFDMTLEDPFAAPKALSISIQSVYAVLKSANRDIVIDEHLVRNLEKVLMRTEVTPEDYYKQIVLNYALLCLNTIADSNMNFITPETVFVLKKKLYSPLDKIGKPALSYAALTLMTFAINGNGDALKVLEEIPAQLEGHACAVNALDIIKDVKPGKLDLPPVTDILFIDDISEAHRNVADKLIMYGKTSNIRVTQLPVFTNDTDKFLKPGAAKSPHILLFGGLWGGCIQAQLNNVIKSLPQASEGSVVYVTMPLPAIYMSNNKLIDITKYIAPESMAVISEKDELCYPGLWKNYQSWSMSLPLKIKIIIGKNGKVLRKINPAGENTIFLNFLRSDVETKDFIHQDEIRRLLEKTITESASYVGTSSPAVAQPDQAPIITPPTQMKELGPRSPMDEDSEMDLKAREKKFEEEAAKTERPDDIDASTPLEKSTMQAKVIYADLGKDASGKELDSEIKKHMGAYHFWSDKQNCLIIVLNERNKGNPRVEEEAKFHEAREYIWLKRSLDGIPARLTQHQAHIIASAEGVVKFSDNCTTLTPYHKLQTSHMTDEEKQTIISETEEARAMQHEVLGIANSLGAGIDIGVIRGYENMLRMGIVSPTAEIEKNFPRGKLPVNIEIVKVEKRPEPVLRPDKDHESDILNAGALKVNGFRLLFARRSLAAEIDGIRKSEIGLYIHNQAAQASEEAITVVDRAMLTPDDKSLTKNCGEVIALEDPRVIHSNGRIFVYLTVVEKGGRYYSAVTSHDRHKFLEIIKGNGKPWEWSPLKKLINDGPAKDINVKNFVPFGRPARISDGNGGTKNVWLALYRPDIDERTTIRYAMSENAPDSAWKDVGVYKSLNPETKWWLGASAFVAEIKDIPGTPPLEFMLYHVAAEMYEDHKYYDIRVLVSEKDNPLRYVESKPIIVPELENQYEMNGWVPGAIYTCGAILTGHNPKDNTYTFDIYYSGSDSVVLMATVTLRITPTAAIEPVTVASRNKVTIDALNSEEDTKSRDPMAVVGLPWWISEELKSKDINPDSYLETFEKEVSRQFGQKGRGAADNVHKLKFFFMAKDAPETAGNLNHVLSSIQTGQEIVVFTPQGVDGVPVRIDDGFIDKIFKGHITIIPDAYTDVDIPGTKGFPDFDARIAITRLVAWCKDAQMRKNDEAQAVALDILTKYLAALTGEDIPKVSDLNELLRKIALLKIRPVNYKDITDWRNSYEAVATAL